MADDTMENLISNYGDMSIEELGSSLLQRQSDIAAQRAKEAKKNRKFQQAPIKTRDMDVPLIAPDPFGRDQQGLPDNVLNRLLNSQNTSTSTSSPSFNVSSVAPRTAAPQPQPQPQTRNRLASAFPADGILGLMRT